uniref:Uncharacterized protein MANES_02G028800 n=1 Tax=Rhizophora mucronata TaxID=61149 RepID=A0A2P2J9L0_RHIMU
MEAFYPKTNGYKPKRVPVGWVCDLKWARPC